MCLQTSSYLLFFFFFLNRQSKESMTKLFNRNSAMKKALRWNKLKQYHSHRICGRKCNFSSNQYNTPRWLSLKPKDPQHFNILVWSIRLLNASFKFQPTPWNDDTPVLQKRNQYAHGMLHQSDHAENNDCCRNKIKKKKRKRALAPLQLYNGFNKTAG